MKNLHVIDAELLLTYAFNAGVNMTRRPTELCNLQNKMASGQHAAASIDSNGNQVQLQFKVGNDVICEFLTKTFAANMATANVYPKLREIREHLDTNVIGQDHAKKTLARSLNMHLKRMNDTEVNGVKQNKQNILIIGPAACGKTEINTQLGKVSGVVTHMVDASTLTPSGYRGMSLEEVALDLYNKAGQNVEKAEWSIVQFDEFDKLTSVAGGAESAELRSAVLSELLKFMEGTEISFDCEVDGAKKRVTLNTKNMLVIASGAFEGIERAFETKDGIGLIAEKGAKPSYNEVVDTHGTDVFRAAGMNSQLLGRFPIRIAMKELTVEELVRVQRDVPNSVTAQWTKYFAQSDAQLNIDEEVMVYIAGKAVQNRTGARELMTEYNNLLADIYDEVEMDENIATVNVTMKNGEPCIKTVAKAAQAAEKMQACA